MGTIQQPHTDFQVDMLSSTNVLDKNEEADWQTACQFFYNLPDMFRKEKQNSKNN